MATPRAVFIPAKTEEEMAERLHGLPLRVVLFRMHHQQPQVVVEQPPHLQTLFFAGSKSFSQTSTKISKMFSVWLPWTYYALWFIGPAAHLRQVYVAGEQLSTPLPQGGAVSRLPLPNIYHSAACYYPQPGPAAPDYPESVQKTLQDWWGSNFNRDGNLAEHPIWQLLAQRAKLGVIQRPQILEYWETLGPEQVMALPWPKHVPARAMIQ